jgi:hypothetical protein
VGQTAWIVSCSPIPRLGVEALDIVVRSQNLSIEGISQNPKEVTHDLLRVLSDSYTKMQDLEDIRLDLKSEITALEHDASDLEKVNQEL